MGDAKLRRLRDREQFGTHFAGIHGATVGTSWTDYGAQSVYPFDGATLATGDAVSYVTLFNRSSAATLYVLFETGGTTAVAQAFSLRAGESYNFDIWGISNGACAKTISLQGSASPTTVDLTAFYVNQS